MDAFRSSKVIAVTVSSVLAALSFYAFYTKGSKLSPLIDSPETIARRVDAKADERKEDPEYDVVIIGGGTAGCALAARLSEDSELRVMVLEAGGSSLDVQESNVPAAFGRMMHTHLDYDLFTEPQPHAGGVRKYWPRAKLLGGCSTINAMMFHIGAPTDYDEWALSGQDGASQWAYKEFRKYFLKFEKFIPHPKYPDVDPSLRGTDGPIKVGYFGYLHTVSAQWIQSCMRLGIPANPDLNTPRGTLGVTKIMTYIDSNGQRVTTERAYLTPDVLKRPNLAVAVNSHVTRIIFETRGGKKTAVGVEFAKHKGGPRYRVRASCEVILSAGAVHSPHILMLSGVGPKEHLAKHNIPLVHDLPGVGQNLQDHIQNFLLYRVKNGLSINYVRSTTRVSLLQQYLDLFKYLAFKSGPLTSNIAEAAAFMRLDDKSLFPPDGYDIKDETSGGNAPDFETIIVPLALGNPPFPSGHVISMSAILLRPQSRGTITLQSSDPFDPPLIDPNYLSAHNDVATLVRGLRLLTRIAQTEPLASSIMHDDDYALDHNIHRLTDAELEFEVRKRAETLFHPTSTCRMAKLEDGGVVDPYLRVYGIEHLRIADASIFSRIPAGHTAAPSIAVGEKAADIVKQSLSRA